MMFGPLRLPSECRETYQTRPRSALSRSDEALDGKRGAQVIAAVFEGTGRTDADPHTALCHPGQTHCGPASSTCRLSHLHG